MEYKNYEVKNISGLHEWHEYIVAICLWKIKKMYKEVQGKSVKGKYYYTNIMK